jgi:tRNA pseudouridine55 synthase
MNKSIADSGKKPATRKLDGIVILDKPPNCSSNRLLQQVKRIFAADKAGHTGSLDPLATGVLPICLGEATKVSQFLLDSDKAYESRIRLGIRTTTSDAEGDVVETRDVPAFSEAQIHQVLSQFIGEITQTPSIYSALKQGGVPQYKLARAGKEVIPKVRKALIHTIELLEWEHPYLSIHVSCAKGTYIRTLAEDIGQVLGCGAHVTALRRTKAGPFTLGNALSLEQLQQLAQDGLDQLDAVLLPVDMAISAMLALEVDSVIAIRLQQGQQILLDEPQRMLAEKYVGAYVRIYSAQKFIGIGCLVSEALLKPVRLLSY